ncbi:MAG: alpha/beta fold hydrolase [Phormidesmis sp.]
MLVYLPEVSRGGEKSPLVMISHGLGGDRTSFAYVAKHLASYGFAVAVVEHPGSSSAQVEALFVGETSQGIEPDDMIRRPTSIHTLLDDLETAARTSAIASNVNFQKVGVLGQSLGAYTALALAGATVQRSALEQACPSELSAQLNLSLLVQCPILTLPQPLPPLGDRRIRAAIAINSLDSAVFGPAGMKQLASLSSRLI